MNSTLIFYIFFCIMLISSVIIIVTRWKRYTKYSNGTYINAGQNLIFKTEMSQSEIIQQLKTHNANDTLEYDFFEKNNEYFLEVKGIKRLFFNGILTATFKVEFWGNTQKYIIIHRCNNFQLLYSSICFGHVIPGKYMPCGTMQAAGSSYSYIRHAMCGEEEVTAEKEGVSIYDVMNRLVEQSPAGAKGLVFLPYLVGERSPRWNPDASGSFLGIRMEHEKCDYIRAVLEGVAMNLGIILEKQRENGEIQELVLTGGGAKGDTLSQILADVLGVRLHRLDQVETATSVAAAVIAGIGVGVFKDFSVVDQFVKREKTFVPREEYKPVYDHQKKLFEKGYECLLDYYKMSAEE